MVHELPQLNPGFLYHLHTDCDHSVHLTSKIYKQIVWSNYMLHHVYIHQLPKTEIGGALGELCCPISTEESTLFSVFFLGALQSSLGISLFANSVPNIGIVCIRSQPL